ncbi:protein-lysine methyltransferase METTL21D-like isoform X2 [Agrilus planipennis]|uniref:Protein-lysine methyltransferase METTL21D-like isoform X2 n=1 Tax=Agrilus planipennis TaxID=224129 RepID=A0A7F5RNS4_AGRPL|nr:protein-lysine methyltransferase METTL21D-like isoform X2 [Agrilus planipennis]
MCRTYSCLFWLAHFRANVLLTDLAEVIPLLQLNIKENEKVIAHHGGSVKASILRWGNKDPSINFIPDVVLLADCIYYKQSIDKLLETLDNITENDTRILMSQEMRESDVQKNCWEYFVKRASEKFSFNYVPLSVQNPEYRCPDIKLIELIKKEKTCY